MREISCNLFSFIDTYPICITTNGSVRRNGACVMGRGVAKQAATLYPDLPFDLGGRISRRGNHVHYFRTFGAGVFSFPVKHEWSHEADPELIVRSANELATMVDSLSTVQYVYLPRPGCGNGRLTWDVVRPLIAGILDDQFTICNIGGVK